VNDLAMMLGIIDSPFYFWLSAWWSRGIISFIQFWMWYGNTMIVLIAGVLGIDPTLFDAAEIDGASSPQIFFRITLPSLRTILLYTLVTSLIGGLQLFDVPLLFNLGGPDQKTLTTSVFIYNQAFSGRYFYNRASAASMIMFLIIMVCSSILFYIMRDKDQAKLNHERRLERRLERKRRRATAKGVDA
jgi:multiple sugar transport system permease protein